MIELGKNWAQKGRILIRVDHYAAKKYGYFGKFYTRNLTFSQ